MLAPERSSARVMPCFSSSERRPAGAIQLAEPPTLKKSYKHDIAVVVDRLVASGDNLSRVTDSVETAMGLAGGIMQVNYVDEEGDDAWQSFSEKLSCPNGHPLQLTEIEPRTFSLRRFSAASSVGANSSSASASTRQRYSSSGQGCDRSWVLRPASTCATGTPAVTAASVAPSALEVSP